MELQDFLDQVVPVETLVVLVLQAPLVYLAELGELDYQDEREPQVSLVVLVPLVGQEPQD